MRLPLEIVQFLEAGGLLLTATARSSRTVRSRYADAQLDAGRTVWSAPMVLDWESWLGARFRDLLLTESEDRLLLSPLQERLVWERLLAPTVRDRSLLSTAGIAQLAREAWDLLASHGALRHVERSPWRDAESEVEIFRRAALQFASECRTKGWISHAELPLVLAEAFERKLLSAPPLVGYLGFDRLTAAQSGLLEAMERSGSRCFPLRWRAEPRMGAVLHASASPESEIADCAAWLHSRLSEASATTPRIAVICPDVASIRSEAERVFRRALAPESIAITASQPRVLRYEFSLGIPLGHTPVVKAALLLLRWLAEPLQAAEVSWLLLSGFLNAAGEGRVEQVLATAQYDAKLRRNKCLPWRVELSRFVSQPGTQAFGLGRLLTCLKKAHYRYERLNGFRPYSEWAAAVSLMLADAGWNTGPADSTNFQAVSAWSDVLDRIAALDGVVERVEYASFLEELARHAEETIFAPKSADAPVQIMGAIESSGQAWDAMWFLGADEQSWPAVGRPHPLLPLWLQRETGMPHSTPEIDWQVGAAVTARLAESAAETVFSYAVQGTEGQRRASSLVRELPWRETALVTGSGRIWAPIEDFVDDAAIAWPAERSSRGGHRLIADQAACPFRGFAAVRLRAEDLDEPEPGLDAGQRGTILHSVLERVWTSKEDECRGLFSKRALSDAASSGRLTEIVEHHTAEVLKPLRATASEPWEMAYFAAEERRIVALTLEWLNYELERKDFTVSDCEREIDIEVGGLRLSARVDRIDHIETPEGRKSLLIDYKTGTASVAGWECPRQEQPQLPLYAIFGKEENVAGVLFAEVRRGNPKFSGRVEDADSQLLERVPRRSDLVQKPLDEDTKREWRSALLDMAESFLRGDAKVYPKHYPKTCNFCGLAGLCRVAEMQTSIPASGRDEPESEDGENIYE